MPRIEAEITNKLGLHARASAKLTQLAGSFPCEVWMERGSRRINAKSIMGVMMLAAGKGATVIIDTEGERADEAMQAMLALIANKFGEGE
ncbi:HPr family phosphocarrier protein [Sulfuritalea hydrogenivorans]|jgi:phosphocarrier protein|uniref:Phosphotransferase system, phosphocarrier protein HPr n=1 Tax=Sulfuritalea hydrogenivorans sk43H TaxID=1223802 RepID=W0SK79_9PROT|nr:HPr family phosphocarrier protein [Sulfuritalea hydrogenivorans]MDK9716001.1 HPr family phosphocarrier protein [Sulfuritalea sp.]BAO31281.1 phosphotransferase system, phosphocarrier protein HPr [Sulfuritalea hydrogenivorans sk43H]